jgi:thiol:disulfide interchange protein DsbC
MAIDQPPPARTGRAKTRHRLAIGVITLSVAALATATLAGVLGRESGQEAKLKAALAKSLPGTKVSSIDCRAEAAPRGFCEFVAGRNVFYATRDGRYVLIGQILDLERKIDITERRMRDVGALASAEDLIAGRSPPPRAAGAEGAGSPPQRPGPPQILKVDLPPENAIVHNRGGRLKMTVFTDFNCHFCRQLFADLKTQKDIEVTEYPIAFLGPDSAAKAKIALCAADRATAAMTLYDGGSVKGGGECPDGARRLRQNLDFAQSHGISGTPTIVRADGATNPGWMPAEKLAAWLAGAQG